MKLHGIHHLTAVCGDPVRNVAFYTEVLGLRMVKKTVNFDDPGTWHLYYGDHAGSPGTILTFFPFVGAPCGLAGAGEVTAFSFAVPPGSLAYWRKRLDAMNIPTVDEAPRFGESRLHLNDPEGFKIELVETADTLAVIPWKDSTVPPEHALGAFRGATFLLRDAAPTLDLLTRIMGADTGPAEGPWQRVVLGEGKSAAHLDLFTDPRARDGRMGTGSVHHIAWRTHGSETQELARHELSAAGLGVSPVRDRNYLHSIYFREPGGILFEIATDPPGFTVDEPLETLGSQLRLPPQFEHARTRIEAHLPALT